MGKTWDKIGAKVASALGKKRGWGVPDTEETSTSSSSTETGSSTTAAASPTKAPSDAEVHPSDAASSTSHSDLTNSPTETEESDTMEAATAVAKVRVAAPADKTMRKKRKPTYYVRKDEMTRLKEEIEQLQERLKGEESRRLQADEALSKQLVMNAAIASDVKQNEMMVSGIRAMICARNALRDQNPLETYIRLTTNEDERCQTILSIQEQKIFEGKEFIDEYCKRIVNPTRGMQDCQTYETQKGDYVLDQFDLTPFANATSARQAYDALLGFFSAQEVSITAMFGVLSVRETDDCGESTATQCRLLTTFKSGVQIETNAVMYLRYCDRDDDGVLLDEPYGFVTMDYVNQDDSFPYQTSERVREDITMVGLIRAFPNPLHAAAETNAEREGIPEKIVGMARWGFTRLVKPECAMPPGAIQELRDSIRSFSDAMPQVMAEIITTKRTSKFY